MSVGTLTGSGAVGNGSGTVGGGVTGQGGVEVLGGIHGAPIMSAASGGGARKIEVYEGEEDDPEFCLRIGKVVVDAVKNEPALK